MVLLYDNKMHFILTPPSYRECLKIIKNINSLNLYDSNIKNCLNRICYVKTPSQTITTNS